MNAAVSDMKEARTGTVTVLVCCGSNNASIAYLVLMMRMLFSCKYMRSEHRQYQQSNALSVCTA